MDGAITYYDARTSDVIFALPTSPSSGYGSQVTNGGKIENKGLELTLNYRVFDTPDYRWEVGVNWARNRGRLTELTGATFVNLTGGFGVSTAVVGEPLGIFYGTDFVRCRYEAPDADNVQTNDAGDDVDVNAACRAANAPNHAMYIDEDGFPLQDQANRVIGNPNPKWTGSVRTGVTLYRKLQISALVDIKRGGDNWNGTRGALQRFGTHGFTAQRATCTLDANDEQVCTGNEKVFGRDILKGPVVGPGAQLAVPIGQNWYFDDIGSSFTGPTSEGVESGGYTKLREISVAYTFDQPWVRRSLGISTLDVRLAGRNLHTWTNYSGVDPETNLYGSFGVGRGQDYFNSPQTRSFVLTVGLNR
jgi:hypothetical protein